MEDEIPLEICGGGVTERWLWRRDSESVRSAMDDRRVLQREQESEREREGERYKTKETLFFVLLIVLERNGEESECEEKGGEYRLRGNGR